MAIASLKGISVGLPAPGMRKAKKAIIAIKKTRYIKVVRFQFSFIFISLAIVALAYIIPEIAVNSENSQGVIINFIASLL